MREQVPSPEWFTYNQWDNINNALARGMKAGVNEIARHVFVDTRGEIQEWLECNTCAGNGGNSRRLQYKEQ